MAPRRRLTQFLELVVFACAACDGRLTRVESLLTVEPVALDFEATPVGEIRTLPLRLVNGSRAPLALHLSAPQPFALELDLKLQGGDSRTVDVLFSPLEPGVKVAALRVTQELELEVALAGVAVAVAQCATPSVCRLSSRDPATNACVEVSAPDGTACSPGNACLASGQCLAGACLGAARPCDDGDWCTVDACDPEAGCLHLALECPQPLDPCQVARCDPASGCATVSAADGTSCGPSDCTTARVCLAGACRTLGVPDGYACGDGSVCRAKGRCSAGHCEQPPPVALAEAWHVALPAQTDFRGVTDPAGNLYWVECEPVKRLNPCQLVSYSAGGTQRFRVPVATLAAPGEARHLWSAGRIVVASRGAAVTVVSDLNGAVVWTRTAPGETTLMELAADEQGRPLTLERVEGDTEAWALNTFDAATGLPVTTPVAGRAFGLVLDGFGNRYLALEPMAGGAASLVSLSPAGTVRFSVATGGIDAPVAAFGGEVLLASGELRSAIDGSVRPGNRRWAPLSAPSPLMSALARYRWQDDARCDAGCMHLEGFAPGIAAPQFSWSPAAWAPQASQTQLLADGTALFASSLRPNGPATDDVYLRAINASGAERFACLLGPALHPDRTVQWSRATALTRGRWAVVERTHCPACVTEPSPLLRVYATPGLSLAAAGWSGPRGNPGASGSPR